MRKTCKFTPEDPDYPEQMSKLLLKVGRTFNGVTIDDTLLVLGKLSACILERYYSEMTEREAEYAKYISYIAKEANLSAFVVTKKEIENDIGPLPPTPH